MAKRKIIEIDEEKCTGCGNCIPGCPEGALQVIDGKARLISDLFCDGLGACVGECPEGAMHVIEREAEPYQEKTVMANIVKAGPNTVRAHLEHLREHGEEGFLKEALEYLEENGHEIPEGFAGGERFASEREGGIHRDELGEEIGGMALPHRVRGKRSAAVGATGVETRPVSRLIDIGDALPHPLADPEEHGVARLGRQSGKLVHQGASLLEPSGRIVGHEGVPL